MLTLTIEGGSSQNIKCKDLFSALDYVVEQLENQGVVSLFPVQDSEVLAQLEEHKHLNKGRDLSTYDNI